MKLRLALLVVLVAAIAVVLLGGTRFDWMGQARHAGSSAPALDTETFTPLPRDSAQQFGYVREQALAPYRLRPDHRLALAVAEVRRLAGAPDSAVTTTFAAGRWTLRSGGEEVGKLSELPDFPEMLDLLTEWARKHAWARGWSESPTPAPPDLLRALDRLDAPGALREADRAWAAGARDAALFRAVSRAYAMLGLETPGHGAMADHIAARSFAALAYARALGADDPKREASLLAEGMGYSAAATDLASKLPAKDPVRLYVTWDDHELERIAIAAIEPPPSPTIPPPAKTTAPKRRRTGKASKTARRAVVAKPAPPVTPQAPRLEAPFFHLLRLASRGDYNAWFDLMSRLEKPGVPRLLVLSTGLRVPHPEPSRLVGEKLIAAVEAQAKADARSRKTAAAPSTLGQHIERIELALANRKHPAGGFLYSADFARAHERSLLYAALDGIAAHSLEWTGPAERTSWFAAGSQGSRHNRRASAFQRWYEHLAQASTGKPDVAALRADVDSSAPGPDEALRSYEAVRPYLPDDGALRATAKDLARRLDSRPEHQEELAAIAERDLLALTLAERLNTSAAELRGASEATRPTATEPSLPDSLLGASLARRASADPAMWRNAERYAAWLEQRGRYAAARGVVERWIAHSPGDTGATAAGIESRVLLARLHHLEGRPEQGLRLLGDLHRSGHFGAMERTALILQDLGQTHRALAIAWSAHRGEPRLAAGRALLAELFWRQGRHADAAKILQEGRAELPAAAWSREIAPRYVAWFRTRGREGLMAADALVKAGFLDQGTIGALPTELGAQGLHAFAFELRSRIPFKGAERVESALLAYGHLKRANGGGAALQWIQSRVPEKDREALGLLAYEQGHTELLWTMPARSSGERGDYLWLLRAAACMKLGPSDPRYAETVQHVERARGSYHLEVARYLLGLNEQSELLSLALDPRQRSEAAYFIGLKTERRGRFSEAADWYLMSVESAGRGHTESRWAQQRLRQWATEGKPADQGPSTKLDPA